MRESVVIPSWELVNKASLIKKFNAVPAMLDTLYFIFIVVYQVAYTSLYVVPGAKDTLLGFATNLAQHQDYALEIGIFLGIGFLSYLILNPIAEGGVLCLIDGYYNKDVTKYDYGYGVSKWLYNFWSLSEQHSALMLFKPVSILTFTFLLMRILGQDYAVNISVGMGIYFLLAILINTLFAYSRILIVFNWVSFMESIALSTRLALSNFRLTLKLYLTVFFVYIRTIFAAALFIVFPALISGIFAWFTSTILIAIFVIITIILFLIALIFLTQLNSVLTIFVDSLWYHAFQQVKWDLPPPKK